MMDVDSSMYGGTTHLFFGVSHILTFLLLHFFPKEVQGRDVP